MYPIINLLNYQKDIRNFVYRIEEIFIKLLQEDYGIDAYRDDKKYTGVWVGCDKITAIGIAVKRWVTMHGFAFNVNTQLEHYKWINPCGLTDRGITSIEKLTEAKQDFDSVVDRVAHYFCDVFNLQPVYLSEEELYQKIGRA